MAERLFVSTKDESPKLFDNPFFDFFSRVPFYVPLIIFIPLITYYSYLSFSEKATTVLQFAMSALIGAFLWTIAEYLIHRFVFHAHPKSNWAKKIHYTFHGIHHDYPQDSLRLVMPPAVSLPLALFFYWLFYWIMAPLDMLQFHYAYYVGFVAAYLFYDMMHYASHHVAMSNPYFKMIKEHHMKHHYKNPDEGFGFTSKVWDRVFSTDFKED
ncbi:MAG: sterol desaturase family protein [Chitinophagales bacterium]|nr:sterol desaturase family protein [Bacteroidota bacterium]MCB9255763.1 sterol desaturase family protein [Chitinophagales bacterium]